MHWFISKVLRSYQLGWVRSKLLTFVYNDKRYHYFCHRYNATWRNERTVEVPLVWHEVQQARGKRVLELGNVLSHYYPITHDVIDKYEKAPGVRNDDIVSFHPTRKYDLIVSISTLEHVGWDEKPQSKLKTKKALEVIARALKKGGKAYITFPVGYNPYLDELMTSGKLPFDERYFLKRISLDNRWIQVPLSETKNASYGYPFSNANVLAVGIIRK